MYKNITLPTGSYMPNRFNTSCAQVHELSLCRGTFMTTSMTTYI